MNARGEGRAAAFGHVVFCLDCNRTSVADGDWFGHGAVQAMVYDADGRLVRVDIETVGVEAMPIV